jgi:hypothetical protein
MPWRLYMLVVCIGLAGCGQEKKNDIWQVYDVRHPLPADATVPDSYSRQYDAYQHARLMQQLQQRVIDNDLYYSRPSCGGGFSSPACMGVE